jgi:hypothetical protein
MDYVKLFVQSYKTYRLLLERMKAPTAARRIGGVSIIEVVMEVDNGGCG